MLNSIGFRTTIPIAAAIALVGLAAVVIVAPSWTTANKSGQVTTTLTITSSQTITVSGGQMGSYSLCFSPNAGCASRLISSFNGANTSIHALIYTFTNQNIATALVDAKNRGVDVKILMDCDQAQNSYQMQVEDILQGGGVPFKTYCPSGGILHDKVAVIDGVIVATGSFNWSNAADNSNNENLLIVRSPELARSYSDTFNSLWSIA